MTTKNQLIVAGVVLTVGGIATYLILQANKNTSTPKVNKPTTTTPSSVAPVAPSSSQGSTGTSAATNVSNPSAPPMFPSGTIIKSGKHVYYMGDDGLRHYVSGAVFSKYGFNQANAVVVPENVLTTIPSGADLAGILGISTSPTYLLQ